MLRERLRSMDRGATARHLMCGVLTWLALGCGSTSTPPPGATPSDAGAVTGSGTGGGSLGTGGSDRGGVGGGSGATGGHGAVATGGIGAGGAAGTGAGGTGSAGRSGATGLGGSAAGGGCPDIGAGPITTTTQHLDIRTHDPSMAWDGARYALFSTGGLLNVLRSPDMRQWTSAGNIFDTIPSWIPSTLGSTPPDLWAPDISFFDCKFHVYYAGSTFGLNVSVIGLATTPTLDPTSPSYHWTDEGLIVRSIRSDTFNAIDPNVAFDENGTPWLAFGSYWTGIKLRQLDATTGKPATSNTTMYSLASRNGSSIEGASIVSHNGYYYLFVSFGRCCAGVNSTYETMGGRATKITGPYTTKAGKDMMQGFAELLLSTSGRYIGPGGGTAFRNGTSYLYAYHYYDGDGGGVSKLQVRPINWDSSDWPVLGSPLFP